MLHAQQPEPVLTTASVAVPVAVPEPSTPDTVRLLVGRSTLVDLGTPIARVSLTSADVADALVTSPNQLLVHGKVPGAISMFVWSRGGDVRRFEVAVQRDLTKLTDQVKQLFPNEAIQVHGNGRSVVLSGTVGSKDVVDRAINVALGFVEKKEDVVTLLQVREGRISNQVLLKVRFAEVSRSGADGVRHVVLHQPDRRQEHASAASPRSSSRRRDSRTWRGPRPAATSAPTSTSAEGKLSFADFLNVFLLNQKYDLGVVIKAMQSRGLFQSLAEPNLVAESGKEASFLAGGEFPVPIVQGSGANMGISVQFKEFGIRLNFTPTVNGDRVHLKVQPEVSTLDYGNAVTLNGFRIPALSTRRAETELELRNGQTFAVAGLMNNQVASTMQKMPGIGDIPILGHLFKSRAAQKDQTELVVMITPEILPNDSDGVTNALPRTPDSFLAPLPEPKTKAPLPPAFTPDRRSTVSVPVPSKAAQIEQKDQREKAEAERDRLAAEAARHGATPSASDRSRKPVPDARGGQAGASTRPRRRSRRRRCAGSATSRSGRERKRAPRRSSASRKSATRRRAVASRGGQVGSAQVGRSSRGAGRGPGAALQQGEAVQQAVDNAAAQDRERRGACAAAGHRRGQAARARGRGADPAQVEK